MKIRSGIDFKRKRGNFWRRVLMRIGHINILVRELFYAALKLRGLQKRALSSLVGDCKGMMQLMDSVRRTKDSAYPSPGKLRPFIHGCDFLYTNIENQERNGHTTMNLKIQGDNSL